MNELQEISNSIFSNNTIGLIVAVLIFVFAMVLLIRKIIGIVVTIILLFFAIISGLAVANNDIVRDYLIKRSERTRETTPAEKAPGEAAPAEVKKESETDWDERFNHLKEQLIQMFQELKEDYYQWRDKDKDTEKKETQTTNDNENRQ